MQPRVRALIERRRWEGNQPDEGLEDPRSSDLPKLPRVPPSSVDSKQQPPVSDDTAGISPTRTLKSLYTLQRRTLSKYSGLSQLEDLRNEFNILDSDEDAEKLMIPQYRGDEQVAIMTLTPQNIKPLSQMQSD